MALLPAVDPITINLLITGLNACWGLAPEEAKGMAEAAGCRARLVLISAAADLLCNVTQGTSHL